MDADLALFGACNLEGRLRTPLEMIPPHGSSLKWDLHQRESLIALFSDAIPFNAGPYLLNLLIWRSKDGNWGLGLMIFPLLFD